ncbi:MAG: hypothetical protein MSC30_13150 [Gaiellaceae bacterium MAG52_C11]|nr:hypothetical protein [Candidatus Gaiellasilicea maunaloa]
MDDQERDRGNDDERFQSGEEAIDSSGRNPTQRRIDEGNDAPVDIDPDDREPDSAA